MNVFYDQISNLINLLVYNPNKGWLWESKPIINSFNSIYKDFYKIDSDRLNHNKEYRFDILKDESVEKLLPHLQEFNENKFWIISENPKIKLNTDELLVEKNSQKLIIGKGDYLKGGSFQDNYSTNNRLTVPSKTSTFKLKAKKFVNDNKKRFKIGVFCHNGAYYCRRCKKVVLKGDCVHNNLVGISGTDFRNKLKNKLLFLHARKSLQAYINKFDITLFN